MDIGDRVRQMLAEQLHREVSEDAELVDTGLLDSVAFLTLFTGLEDEFGIEIVSNDLRLTSFRTARQIADFVLRKQERRS